jgi:hypothetical protein
VSHHQPSTRPNILRFKCRLSPCGHEVFGIGLEKLLKYAISRELRGHEDMDIGDELHSWDPQLYDESDLEKFKHEAVSIPFLPEYCCPVCCSRVVTAPLRSRHLTDLAERISEIPDPVAGGPLEFWDAGDHEVRAMFHLLLKKAAFYMPYYA